MSARPALLIALSTLAVGCTNDNPCNDVTSARATPGVDFDAIETFSVLSAADYPEDLPEDLPDDVETSLRAADRTMREELVARGLTEVDDEDDPDVLLFSLAATETESGTEWVCVGDWVWWGGWWGWVWDPCAWLTPIEVEYGVGTVVVGMGDPDEEEVVFGGVAQGVLYCSDPQTRIERAVREIFESYPVEVAE